MFYLVIEDVKIGQIWMVKAEDIVRAREMVAIEASNSRVLCITQADLTCLQGNSEVLIKF